ncbi:Cleft lip and palate transmembrane family protein, partial [Globisporangium splendens]
MSSLCRHSTLVTRRSKYGCLCIYKIINPQFTDIDGPTLDPLWEEGQGLNAEFYISPRQDWNAADFSNPQVLFVGSFSDLSYDWDDNERFQELNISKSSLLQLTHQGSEAANPSQKQTAAHKLWSSIRGNGTVYLHVHVTKDGASPNPSATNYHRLKTVHQSNPLIQYAPRQNAKNATFLLEKYFPERPKLVEPPARTEEESSGEEEEEDFGEDPALSAPVISYWKPHMAIRLVTDFKKYPYQEVPVMVYHNLRYFEMNDKSWKYVPSMYLDDMGLTMDKLLPLNRSIHSLPLKISYEPMSYARWQLLLTMEMALKSQESLGFQASDIDSLRSMIAETNPYLLAVTMTVSLLHILFDWLAFKNDIAYWRKKNDDMVGISLRSMVISLVSQFIVLLYLVNEEATLLITAPSAISCVLLVWKILKIWRARGSTSKAMKQTSQVDEMATSHMMLVLAPLLLGYSAYSLLHKQHLSWYGWLLGSLTGAVYAFGFIMMMPQLVINYKLKSVAHLQWRYLIYRALNTFIDDLFAFIITMPTMHRLSCFRDDIIFFIYLYQRWIYPVDSARKFDEDDGEKSGENGVQSQEQHLHHD